MNFPLSDPNTEKQWESVHRCPKCGYVVNLEASHVPRAVGPESQDTSRPDPAQVNGERLCPRCVQVRQPLTCPRFLNHS
jgi:hypothetical protein